MEGKRAVEILPIAKDALDGPDVMTNLALVYAWTDEFDLAFETLVPLTKMPSGVYYGQLKLRSVLGSTSERSALRQTVSRVSAEGLRLIGQCLIGGGC